MTRLFPREVVTLLQLQVEADRMLNAMLKESRHLFEVTESGNNFNIDRFGPGSTVDNGKGLFSLAYLEGRLCLILQG